MTYQAVSTQQIKQNIRDDVRTRMNGIIDSINDEPNCCAVCDRNNQAMVKLIQRLIDRIDSVEVEIPIISKMEEWRRKNEEIKRKLYEEGASEEVIERPYEYLLKRQQE